MSQCPQCHTEIALAFGITQCPQCQHLFMGDIEEPKDSFAPQSLPPTSDPPTPLESPELIGDQWLFPQSPAIKENPLSDNIGEIFPENISGNISGNITENIGENISEDIKNESRDVVDQSSTALAEIAQYGNSELSAGREGFLLFTLNISGIDSGQTLSDLRTVLADPRFLLNVDKLIGSVQMGRLTIPALSPVKASLLVNRLKEYPLEITWEQYAITRPKESPKAVNKSSG